MFGNKSLIYLYLNYFAIVLISTMGALYMSYHKWVHTDSEGFRIFVSVQINTGGLCSSVG